MKTLKSKLWLLILFLIPIISKAQYGYTIQTSQTPNYIYVGSLTLVSTDLGNLQKIQVDIFGGGWGSDGLGVTTYTIANRGGLVVNQVRMGSTNSNYFNLQAYTNSSNNNIDFYIVTSNWSAFGIKSVMAGGPLGVNQLINNTQSTTPPTGTPLNLNINPVLITDASGNIGIGTANPNGYKFAVKGTLHAQQVNVDLTNWADYVFTPTYALPTLSEVKTYIDQNHHLPEIPSEHEVIKNGINLGEMNKLLVKKVEELTLYLIEKDKKEKEQEELIKALMERLNKVENKIHDQINSKN